MRKKNYWKKTPEIELSIRFARSRNIELLGRVCFWIPSLLNEKMLSKLATPPPISSDGMVESSIVCTLFYFFPPKNFFGRFFFRKKSGSILCSLAGKDSTWGEHPEHNISVY